MCSTQHFIIKCTEDRRMQSERTKCLRMVLYIMYMYIYVYIYIHYNAAWGLNVHSFPFLYFFLSPSSLCFLYWVFSSLHHLYPQMHDWIPCIEPITAQLALWRLTVSHWSPSNNPLRTAVLSFLLDWAWRFILDLRNWHLKNHLEVHLVAFS